MTALFLSDIHLGFMGSKVEYVNNLLKNLDSRVDTIYLVGDIIDQDALRRKWYWPESHNEFVRQILAKSLWGIRVVYIRGNHDFFLDKFLGQKLGNIEIKKEDIYTTCSGKKYLVVHGDCFDVLINNSRTMSNFGIFFRDFFAYIDIAIKKLGFNFSLTQLLTLKIDNIVDKFSNYKKMLEKAAKKYKVDGIIVGHTHFPMKGELKEGYPCEYINTGDWVTNKTFAVENTKGEIELIKFNG